MPVAASVTSAIAAATTTITTITAAITACHDHLLHLVPTTMITTTLTMIGLTMTHLPQLAQHYPHVRATVVVLSATAGDIITPSLYD